MVFLYGSFIGINCRLRKSSRINCRAKCLCAHRQYGFQTDSSHLASVGSGQEVDVPAVVHGHPSADGLDALRYFGAILAQAKCNLVVAVVNGKKVDTRLVTVVEGKALKVGVGGQASTTM